MDWLILSTRFPILDIFKLQIVNNMTVCIFYFIKNVANLRRNIRETGTH